MFEGIQVTDGQLSAIIGAVYLVSTILGSSGIKLVWESYCNSKLKRDGLVYLDERPSNIDAMSLLGRFTQIRRAKRTRKSSKDTQHYPTFVRKSPAARAGHSELIILTALLFLSYMGLGQVLTPLGIKDNGIRDAAFTENTRETLCLPTLSGTRAHDQFMVQAIQIVTQAHCAGLDDRIQVGSVGTVDRTMYSSRGRPKEAGDLITASRQSGIIELEIDYLPGNSISTRTDFDEMIAQGPEANIGELVRNRIFLQRTVLPLELSGNVYYTMLRSGSDTQQLVGFSCTPRQRGPWPLGTNVTVTLDCWSFLNQITGLFPGLSLLTIEPSTISEVVGHARVRGSCREIAGGRRREMLNATETIHETARLVAASHQVAIALAIGEQCQVEGEVLKIVTELSTWSQCLLIIGAIFGFLLFIMGIGCKCWSRKSVNWSGSDTRIINLASNRQQIRGDTSNDLTGCTEMVAIIHDVDGELHLKSYHGCQMTENMREPVRNAVPEHVQGAATRGQLPDCN